MLLESTLVSKQVVSLIPVQAFRELDFFICMHLTHQHENFCAEYPFMRVPCPCGGNLYCYVSCYVLGNPVDHPGDAEVCIDTLDLHGHGETCV